MPVSPIEIANRDGLPIRGDLHLPVDGGPSPLILVAHGFKGFKDWGFFPWLAEGLAASGLAALRFNFARNGIGDDPLSFDRLDLFEENSITREILDLEDLLTALADHPSFEKTDLGRIGLFGHSRGGGVAVLFAAREPGIRSLATWASVSHFPKFFTEEVLADWGERGVLLMENKRTGQLMPLGRDLYRDLTEGLSDIDVTAAEAKLAAPHLVLHGDADESVPVDAAHALRDASGGRTRMVVIPGAGHTFGTVHPFADSTPALDLALSETVDHFASTL